MSSPLVSVIVPAFDAPEYLAEALGSVLSQSERDFELIVVDDGSHRDLAPAVEPCRTLKDRFLYIRQDNAGGAAARNRGVAMARGEWIAFLDHDDRWLPDKLSRQLAAAQIAGPDGEKPGMIFCQFRKIGATEDPRPFPDPAPASCSVADLLRRTLIRTLSSVLIRRSAVPEESWFREDLEITCDVEFYYRIGERTRIHCVPEILVEKREHDHNATRDSLRMHQEAVQIADELAERLGTGLSAETARLLRARIWHHLVGSAKAANRGGNRKLSRACYRRAIRLQPRRIRALLGYVSTWM